jgi:hypothetical protein
MRRAVLVYPSQAPVLASDYRTLKAYLDAETTLDHEELHPVNDIMIRLQCWILPAQKPGLTVVDAYDPATGNPVDCPISGEDLLIEMLGSSTAKVVFDALELSA